MAQRHPHPRTKEGRRTKTLFCPKCNSTEPVRPDSTATKCRVCKAPLLPGLSSPLHQEVLRRVKSRQYTLVELANELDVSPVRVQEALTELRDKGNYCVTVDPGRITIEQPTPHPEDNRHLIDTEEFFGEEIKFGAISDTHLGSRWERLDVLKSLYDIFEREGVRVVFHAGNLIEGDARWNKYDVWVHGFEQQTQYAVDHYPQRKGIVTKFICGDDHEGWFTQREGIDFGRRLVQDAQAAGRNDLEYLGYVEADIELKAKHGSSVMRVMHPGGGTAYAISYTSQKIVESLQGGEKPAVLLLGHFHKFEQSYVRNVHVVQVGCCEDQSIFMRKRKLEAMVGGCLIKFRQGSTGEVNRFSCEWFPYFDRGFYGKKYDILRRVA